ncbi:MAG: TetR/AcrR family transcriptional regulator [Streptomycetaceae bacterium]|nr:MAG: TetR/AcrR family transcriptional regulator [Streptomycetaceae bacterium]
MALWSLIDHNFEVKTAHPTKITLINTVVDLLENQRADELTSEQVLEISNISKGSLYHHFIDFSALIDAARIVRYARWADRSIQILTTVMNEASNRAQFFEGLARVFELTQSPASRSSRFERARIVGMAEGNPRLMHDLGEEQQRLTDSITELVIKAQNAGYLRSDLDSASIALLIQGYAFGKIIDDIATLHIDPKKWNALIADVIEKSLATQA